LPTFAIIVYYIYKTNYEIYKHNASALITSLNNQMTDKLLALLDPIGDSLVTLAKASAGRPTITQECERQRHTSATS
jgi:hypothetical protein